MAVIVRYENFLNDMFSYESTLRNTKYQIYENTKTSKLTLPIFREMSRLQVIQYSAMIITSLTKSQFSVIVNRVRDLHILNNPELADIVFG